MLPQSSKKPSKTVKKSKFVNFLKLADDFEPADKLKEGGGLKVNNNKKKRKKEEVRGKVSWELGGCEILTRHFPRCRRRRRNQEGRGTRRSSGAGTRR